MHAFAQALLKTRYATPATIPAFVAFLESNSHFRDIQLEEFFRFVGMGGQSDA